jgi:hypothetical protein
MTLVPQWPYYELVNGYLYHRVGRRRGNRIFLTLARAFPGRQKEPFDSIQTAERWMFRQNLRGSVQTTHR